MSKTISHYVARFDMPGWKKGEKVIGNAIAATFPDVFAPVYKETPIIPPGVVKMIYPTGIISNFDESFTATYKDAVEYNLGLGAKYHTISVNGTEYSVGDWVKNQLQRLKIKSFSWTECLDGSFEWRANYEESAETIGSDPWDRVSILTKLPTRTPICQLSDENGNMVDGFDGQTAWVVQDNWKIFECLLHQDNAGRVHRNFFATKAAAEKYVFDNKSFYPRGLVEPLIQAWNSMGFSPLHVGEAFDNLEAFKEKHLKDKV